MVRSFTHDVSKHAAETIPGLQRGHIHNLGIVSGVLFSPIAIRIKVSPKDL